MTRQVNLVRSKVRQRMTTRLAESSGRPLERHGNVSPREMAVDGGSRLLDRTRRTGRPIRILQAACGYGFAVRP